MWVRERFCPLVSGTLSREGKPESAEFVRILNAALARDSSGVMRLYLSASQMDYRDYLRSAHWRALKARYRESGRPQDCYLCGEKKGLALHHLTYDRLGCEFLTDLVPLCRPCHTMVCSNAVETSG